MRSTSSAARIVGSAHPWEDAYSYSARAMDNIARTYSGEQGHKLLSAQGYDPAMIEAMEGPARRPSSCAAAWPSSGPRGSRTLSLREHDGVSQTPASAKSGRIKRLVPGVGIATRGTDLPPATRW